MSQTETLGSDGEPVTQSPSLLSSAAPRPGVLTPGLFVLCAFLGFAAVAGLTLSLNDLKGIRPPESARVYRWSGEGSAKTVDTFRVQPGWELRWEHSGDWGQVIEEIAWITPDGTKESVVSFPNKPLRHHGSVNVDEAGEYRLEVTGRGRWTIDVYQIR